MSHNWRRAWRPIEGVALMAFCRGKTVADMEVSSFETVTVFTDGSAVRCTPLEGAVYSTVSGDSPTVEWEASDRPVEDKSGV